MKILVMTTWRRATTSCESIASTESKEERDEASPNTSVEAKDGTSSKVATSKLISQGHDNFDPTSDAGFQ